MPFSDFEKTRILKQRLMDKNIKKNYQADVLSPIENRDRDARNKSEMMVKENQKYVYSGAYTH